MLRTEASLGLHLVNNYWLLTSMATKKTSRHSEIKDAAADDRLRRLQAYSFPATNKNAVARVFRYTRVNGSIHISVHWLRPRSFVVVLF